MQPIRRLRLAAFGLALGLLALSGCNRDAYDANMTYPVRADWLVFGNIDIQPTRFNGPGHMPLDGLNGDEKLLTPDQIELKKKIGTFLFDPNAISPEVRAQFGIELQTMFGTPAKPTVGGFAEDALKLIDASLKPADIVATLDLGDDKLAAGSKLYRQHCLHCHGLEGNGRGPTGLWVNPHPRDYRQGIFKFTSSTQDQGSRKPRREDLTRVLVMGIEGTSMPSFNVLPKDQLEAIVSYVIHLSLRGEAEYATMLDHLKLVAEKRKAVEKAKAEGKDSKAVDALPEFSAQLRADDDDFKKKFPVPNLKQSIEDNVALAVNRWVEAQKADKRIVAEPYVYANDEKAFLESANRGYKLFAGKGGCITCHQNYGREANYSYDAWGTIVRGRNIYEGVYRGGRRPIDLYNRIHGGIYGAGMTGYKDIKATLAPDDLGLKTPEELAKDDVLWDLVNFLRAAAYPDQRMKLRNDYGAKLPE